MRAETVLARSAVTVKPVEARFDVLEGRKQLSDVLRVVELTRISVTAQIAAQEQAHQGQAIADDLEAVFLHHLACSVGQLKNIVTWGMLQGSTSRGHAAGTAQELASGLELIAGQVVVAVDAETVLQFSPYGLERQARMAHTLPGQLLEPLGLGGGDTGRCR